MTAQANIVAFDGAATPVTHTFVPDGTAVVDGSIEARWKELSASIPDKAKIRIRTNSRKNVKTGMYRNVVTYEVPVMESISGQNAAGYTAMPAIAYVNVAQLVLLSSDRSSDAERRLLRQLVINTLGNVPTSVAPVSTGFMPEFVDQLITAS